MLKKCYRLFLGLLVVTGSACVTPTHASSASIIITNIQAGSPTGASEEAIVLYNNSSFEANITNWCLANKLAVKFACFSAALPNELSILPPYSYATAVSSKVLKDTNHSNFSVIYEPGTGVSGSIVASADTITLIDSSDQPVDQFSWTSSISSSRQWSRTKLSLLPDIFIDTNASIDWQQVSFGAFPISQLEYRHTEPEIPPDEPVDEPTEEPSDTPDGTGQPEVPLPAVITELLPNAVGSDTGNEFIEMYNPNKLTEVLLGGYKLAVGPGLEKVITLTEYILKPGEYKVFTNAQLGFSLLNTSSRVTLFMPNGDIASEVPMYDSPPDGESWALINDLWQYSTQPTPGVANVSVISSKVEKENQSSAASIPKACAANQYRSPETNRCRLISSSASSSPAPCKADQQRNPETGRCKAIVSTTAATCKAGQEKNPETNRCRNIKQLSTAAYGVKGATTKQQGGMGWYMWAAVVAVVLLVVGYGVWEWRDELKKLFEVVKGKFAGKPN